MKWRASQIGKLMTTSRSKTDALSQTAKSYINQIAKENFYGYSTELSSKYLDKGTNQELESINLLNAVRFTDHKKNTLRLENDFITGECDIITNDSVIDVKTPWSLDTFPELPEDIDAKEYEWQGRAYMMLYNRFEFELVYCLVSTWDEFLSEWDNKTIHKVDHIEPHLRITSVMFERDLEIEAQMIERCQLANEYYIERINKLNNK
ncbi:MAG: hypothetical protein EBR91_08140 [Flavobacteriia bacterium]|nr:hypothetical protein [Flavobacteriia bacterium]